MEKKFVHLHTHSHYSLLDGLSKIPELVKKTKELGMSALALTDHGAMYGAIEFYKTCKKNDIKPIIGVEAYMAKRSRHDKEHGIDNKRYHLTLLAKNNTGYVNLMKAVSRANLEGYYYKPRMDKELLQKFSEGVICLSGCPGSEFIQLLKSGENKKARDLIRFYIETFGKEHVFIELMKHDEVEWYPALIPEILTIAKEFDRPVVGTWDSHYLHSDDNEAHDTLLAINTNNSNFKLNGDYHLLSPDEAHKVFSEYPNVASNTQLVADLVDIELDLGNWNFPKFEVTEGETHASVLRKNVYDGVAWRYGELNDEVKERIDFELDVIEHKGFPVYMLIVADLLEFARKNEILTNIRGSVAGSIVTYLLGVTNVDPLALKLPFSRFLNKERPTAPDIDMDFADDRRDEVIEYARQKYGQDAVAQIGTFGKMLARGAVRDVARALGYPYDTGDKIAKLIPPGAQGFPMTLERALNEAPELKELYDSDRPTKEIMDMARKIEGCARHISVHAAGVVISPTTCDDYTPIQLDPKGGKIITQYDMHAVEDAGLIKFDFLGIRNLAILADAIKRVSKIRGIKIDVENMPQEDSRTFQMLARGETMGVFQLSGGGMTKYLMDLKPTTITDINAMVALYRPGPLEMIPEYIKRKQNPNLIKYLDPRMKDILDQSYGVITYQDDVMLIAIKLGGYSWLEADKLRKAMGKKIPELMEEQKKKLANGLREHGMSDKKIVELWSLIEPFAAYGFNKAHAASYGQLAYRTAYMKANYPQEYMSAIMTAESGDIEKVAEVINECRRMGMEIMPPDINESFSDFTVVVAEEKDINKQEVPEKSRFLYEKTPNGQIITHRIRFGLRNIKNFGEEIGKAIIEERKSSGKFTSIESFLERVQHKNLNRKSLEALILCGAMDSMHPHRGQLMENMEKLLAFNRSFRMQNEDQISLFGNLESAPKAKLSLTNAEPIDSDQKLAHEKELLGLYVSGHPLEKFKEKLSKSGMTIKKIREQARTDQNIIFGAIISESKVILTKKQEKMAFLTLSDLTGSIEVVVFPKTYKEFHEILEPDTCVVVKAKVSNRNGEKGFIVDKVKLLQ